MRPSEGPRGPGLSRLAARLAMPALLVCAVWAVSSCTMPQLTKVTEAEFPQSDRCSACHVEIAHEWADSPHARAFVNPRFVAATDHYRFGECLGCHAPAPQRSSDPPQPRTAVRESGVTCVSCHLVEGRMAGPLPPTGIVAPHPVSVDLASYRSVDFCGRCHEGTARQWAARMAATRPDSSSKPTCQDCHMPPVRRKMTQATGPLSAWIVGFEREADEKRHTFSIVPTELKSPPISIELKRGAGGPHTTEAGAGRPGRDEARPSISLTIVNHLPHALPTGDFGVRIIQIRADALDAQGQATPVGRWELTRSGGGAAGTIPAGGSRQWDLQGAPPEGTRSVRVWLTRQGRDDAEPAVVFDGEVPVP